MARKGLKIACVAICCVVLVTILVVPSFAVEGNSRAVTGVFIGDFYIFDMSVIDTVAFDYVIDGDGISFIVYDIQNYTLVNSVFVAIVYNGNNEPYFVTSDGYQLVITSDYAFSILGDDRAINNLQVLLDIVDTYVLSTDIGYNNGYDVGFRLGLTTGEINGYNNGYDAGYSVGFDSGVAEVTDGGSWRALGAFFVNVLDSFTSAQLFYGFTIGGVLTIFVGALLLLWLLKLLR